MSKPAVQHICPLCCCSATRHYYSDAARQYHLCPRCRVVSVPRRYWVGKSEERREYDLHENDIADPRYRKFLARLATPLLEIIGGRHLHGLDFGCGPAPALADMLRQAGQRVELYDPFYFPERALLNQRYDFICATEVVEHLRYPGETFTSLFAMLAEHGLIGVMTQFVEGEEAFGGWHYIRDKTHICFYHEESFRFIARTYGAKIVYLHNDVVIFRKK